jgi:NhaP-type Na+/H+ or K+/H+ antiporter
LLGVAVAGHESLWHWAGVTLVYAVVGAIVVGAALGRGIAVAATKLRERRFLSDGYDRWVGLAAGLAVYGAAQSLGMLGFLAAFAAGIGFPG